MKVKLLMQGGDCFSLELSLLEIKALENILIYDFKYFLYSLNF